MDIADLVMTAAFFATPPILFVAVRNRLRAAIYSVTALWLLLISGAQYHLAYTPDYNSIAPGLTLVLGWLPSTVYTLIWLGVYLLIGIIRPTKTDGVELREN